MQYVPTDMQAVRAMLEVARVSAGDLVYDLGSGDGRIVIAAAKHYGARGVGIDIDPQRIRESQQNAADSGVTRRVRFLQQDLFESDIRQATVVTLYLLPTLNLRLRPKLFAELRPGTRIVSHGFDMGEWEPDTVVTVERDPAGEWTVFFWVLPAQVGGVWELRAESGTHRSRYVVRIAQRFQRIRGTAVSRGRERPLADARLVGDRISFELSEEVDGRTVTLRFSGRVEGDSMRGTLTAGNDGSWKASRQRRTRRRD